MCTMSGLTNSERPNNMTRHQVNVRLPAYSVEQIDAICEAYGLTKTQVIILAVDRLMSDIQFRPHADVLREAETVENEMEKID